MDLNKLKDSAFDNAQKHGWHEKELNNRHWITLIISELQEAIQADRLNKRASVFMFESQMSWFGSHYGDNDLSKISCRIAFDDYIHNSFEDEIADVIIRCLDFAGLRKIDLSELPVYDPEIVKALIDQESLTYVAFDFIKMLIDCVDDDDNLNERNFKEFLFFFLQFCEYEKIKVDYFVDLKMKYNINRPYKHDKKY